MDLLKSVWRSNLLIRCRSWEYWPFEIVYLPVFIYWFWLSFKAKSPLFFTASNPGIENGGMLGESKFKILTKIPDHLVPKTLYFSTSATVEEVMKQMKKAGLTFPVICKPDIGERGWKVQKIENDKELKKYVDNAGTAFLVQEYINLPLEAGVFYYRNPREKNGIVSSIVLKEMLAVKGDGKSTLQELIQNSDRAKLQWSLLKEKFADHLTRVLKEGEQMELVPIGNHCKGTKFLNGNRLINPQLIKSFDEISSKIDGFFYGRYDLRAQTIENLLQGRVKIMELNGAGAEPAHIYHPGASLREGWKVLLKHWYILFQISKENHALGTPYLSIKDGWTAYKQIKQLNK